MIWWAPVLLAALALGPDHVLVTLGVFFSKLAVVSFGGAYALLAYMAQQVVETITAGSSREMVDALGLAETTPGPLILVTQFVSFLAAWRSPAPFDPAVAAMLGAAMATWTVFAPSFLWIFAGAPFIEDLRRNQKLAGALAAITAAVVGVILSLAVWFALHVLFRQVVELSYGPLRWFAVAPGSIDVVAVVLAVIAADSGVRPPCRDDRHGRNHGGAGNRGAARIRRLGTDRRAIICCNRTRPPCNRDRRTASLRGLQPV